MGPHSSQPNLETCSVDDLYQRLAEILKRARPERLAAFKEFLRDEQEQERNFGRAISKSNPR